MNLLEKRGEPPKNRVEDRPRVRIHDASQTSEEKKAAAGLLQQGNSKKEKMKEQCSRRPEAARERTKRPKAWKAKLRYCE